MKWIVALTVRSFKQISDESAVILRLQYQKLAEDGFYSIRNFNASSICLGAQASLLRPSVALRCLEN